MSEALVPCHDLLDAVCSTAAGKVQIGMGFFTVRARALSSRLSWQPGLQVLQPMHHRCAQNAGIDAPLDHKLTSWLPSTVMKAAQRNIHQVEHRL